MFTQAKFKLQLFGKRVGLDYESTIVFNGYYPLVKIHPLLLRDMEHFLLKINKMKLKILSISNLIFTRSKMVVGRKKKVFY